MKNKGKTKAWRREAEMHNIEAGRKHQGRRMKPLGINIEKMPTTLFMKMFLQAARTSLQGYDETMKRYESKTPKQIEETL